MTRRKTRNSRSRSLAVIEALDSRRLFAAIAWTGAADGSSWSVAGNWAGGVIPTAADDVTIAAPTSTVVVSDPRAVLSLSLEGKVQLNSTLAIGGGALTLVNGAQIFIGNTAGSTAGTLEFTGLDLIGGQTVSGTGSIVFGANSSNRMFNNLLKSTPNLTDRSLSRLQFSPGVTVTGKSGSLAVPFANNGNEGDWVNLGTFSFTGTGGTILIPGRFFFNSGLFALSGQTTLTISDFNQFGSNFSNTGTVSVTGGSTLNMNMVYNGNGPLNITGASTLNVGNNFTNNSELTIGPGSTLSVSSRFFNNTSTARLTATGATILMMPRVLGGNPFTVGNWFNSGVFDLSGGTTFTTCVSTPWSNSGTMTFSGGSTFSSDYDGGFPNTGTSWSNSGLISFTGGSFNARGNISNSGTIALTNSSISVGYFGGAITQAGVGRIDRVNSSVILQAAISGGLRLDDTTGTWIVSTDFRENSVNFNGGTVSTTGSAKLVIASNSTATFNGVTLAAAVDGTAGNTAVAISGGLKMAGGSIALGNAAGSTLGRIQFFGTGPATVSGTGSISFGASASNTFANDLGRPAGSTDPNTSALTIAPGISFSSAGGVAFTGSLGSVIDQRINLQSGFTQTGANVTTSFANFIISTGTISLTGTNLAVNFNGGIDSRPGAVLAATGITLGLGSLWSNSGTLTTTDTILNLGGTFLQASLGNFSRTNTAVNLTGNITGDLTLSDATGPWNLQPTGRLVGGSYNASGSGKLVFLGGTFDAVTANAPIDLSDTGATLTIRNGLTLANTAVLLGDAAGLKSGGLSFEGLDLPAGQTLGGVGTVVFGGSTANRLTNNLLRSAGNSVPAATQLTIAPGVLLRGKSGSFTATNAANGNNTLSLQGPVSIDTTGGNFTVSIPVANEAVFTAAPGTTVSFPRGLTQSPTATLTATGATLTLGGSWSNNGLIRGGTGSVLNLGGTFTQAGMGNFQPAGALVNLVGTLTGGLALSPSTGNWTLAGGTVSGGTFTVSGGARLLFSAGTFSGVTATSDIDLATTGGSLIVTNGLTLAGTVIRLGAADGSTAGSLFFDGADVNGGQQLAGTGAILFGGNGSNTLSNRMTRTGGNTDPTSTRLILAPGISLSGRSGTLAGPNADNQILLRGTLSADIPGGTLTVSAPFSNAGTVVAMGGTLVTSGTLINFTAGTLTGGAFVASAGGTLRLGGVSITTLASSLTLDGDNARAFGSTTGFTSLFGAGLTIAQSGSLSVLSAQATSLGALTNKGTIRVGVGSSLTLSGSFNNESTGVIRLDVAGVPTSSFGRLAATGPALLGGTLVVSIAGGFDPQPGASLPVLTASSVNAQFATYTPVAGPSNNPLKIAYTPAAASLVVEIPIAPPSVPVLDPSTDTGLSATDGITSNRFPLFTGTAVTGSLVSLFADGQLIGTAIAAGGTYAIVPTTPLPDGTRLITATASLNGNPAVPSAGSRSIVIDTAAPTLSPPADLIVTAPDNTGARVAFAASATDLLDPAPLLGYSVTPGSLLPLGLTTITATATDRAGNTVSAPFTVTVLDPLRPSIPVLTQASDTGSSNTDGITSDDLPTFTGTAAPGATVTLRVNGTIAGTGVTSPAGVYLITTAQLTDGPYLVSATSTLPGFQPVASQSAGRITIDTTAPSITLPPLGTFQATSNAGTVVTFSALVTDATDPVPTISFSPASGSVFPVGQTVVTATATDRAGNVFGTQFTVTVTGPQRPSTPVLAAASDTGPSNSDRVTSVRTPTFIGTATPGSVVRIFADGVEVGSAPAPSGAYAVTTLPLSDGTRLISVTSTLGSDAPVAATALTTITIDTAAPQLSLPPGLTATARDNAGAALTFTPTATDNLDPAPVVSTTPSSGAVFPVGTTFVAVTATDLAGNITIGQIAVIVSPPVVPSAPQLDPASDTGASNTDRVTRQTTPVFTGSAAPGSTVRLFADGVLVGQTVATAGTYSITTAPLAAGQRVITATSTLPGAAPVAAPGSTLIRIDTTAPLLTLPTLPITTTFNPAGVAVTFTAVATDDTDPAPVISYSIAPGSVFPIGTTTVTVTATDLAGNTATATLNVPVELLSASQTPLDPTLAPQSDTGTSASDRITSINTPTFTGPAPIGSTVRILSDGIEVGSAVITTGTYSIQTNALADGNHVIVASVTLPGGSPQLSAGITVTIDTVAPAITPPTLAPVAATSPSGAIVPYAATLTDAIDPLPAITYTPASGSTLPIGLTTVTVTATDRAGNTASTQFNVTVLPQTVPNPAPSAPVLAPGSDTGASAADGITSDNTPTVTGTAATGATVLLFDGTVQVGSAVATDGTYTITASPLADGSHSLSVRAVLPGAPDAVSPGSLPIVIDTVAPVLSLPPAASVTGIAALDGSGAPVAFSATAADALDASPSLQLSAPPGGTFPIGTTPVTVTATDAAGNSATSTFNVSVVAPAITPSIGGLDTSFGSGTGVVSTTIPQATLSSIDLFSLGGGQTLQVGFDTSRNQLVLTRLLASGTLDSTFGLSGVLRVTPPEGFAARRVQFDQTTGQFYVFGTFGPSLQPAVTRYTPAGTLDTTFFTTGILQPVSLTTADRLDSILPVRGGFVLGGAVVKGSTRSAVLFKITPANSLDTRFATRGIFTRPGGPLDTLSGLTADAKGQIYAVGTTSSGNIADNAVSASVLVLRFSATGRIDLRFSRANRGAAVVGFDGFGLASGQRILLQGDGKLLVAANLAFTASGALAGRFGGGLLRLTSTGLLDPTFNTTGRIVTFAPPTAATSSLVTAPATFSSRTLARATLLADTSLPPASVRDLLDAAQSAVVAIPGGLIRMLATLPVGPDTRLRITQLVGDGADLVPTSAAVTGASTTKPARPNANLSLSLKVANRGTLSARGQLPITIFFSTDQILDPSDTRLTGLQPRATILPGGTTALRLAFKAPTTPATGFILVQLGTITGLGDINLTNNTASSTPGISIATPTRPGQSSALQPLLDLLPRRTLPSLFSDESVPLA